MKELTETHKQNMTNKMRNRLKLFLFLSVLWLISCTPDSDIPSDGKQGTSFESFSLISDLGTEYKSFLIRDSIIHIQVPRKIDLSNLKPSFTFDGKQVLTDDGRDITENSQPSDFSDWLAPHKYTVVSSGSQKQEWTVTLYDLPVLIVDTPEQKSIDSKEVRVDSCRVTLIDEDGVSVDLGTAGIRGRGNSTWKQTKKPYNVKFDGKQSVLGMPSSKHWILLANPHYDRTQLHNATGFEIARNTDFPWVQKGEFVELILNGEHKGMYYICEKIRVEKGKIDVGKEINEDGSNRGGYLLESFVVGENAEAVVLPDYCFTTDYFNITGPGWARRELGWEVKTPDETTENLRTIIRNDLNYIESLFSERRNYIKRRI